MVTASFLIDVVLNIFTIVSGILYIYCEIILLYLVRKGDKERLSSYFYLVFYCGLVNITIIVNQTFFRLLPALIWVDFFYSLGTAGATVFFCLSFGCELFVIMCEAFIAISRYLTFSSNDTTHSYWNLKRLQKFLLGILAVSVLYACSYVFCPFQTNKNAWGTGVTFNFKPNQLIWVGASVLVPLVTGMLSLLSCVVCYYKVATIISATQSGLSRAIVLKMCLSTLIVSLGTERSVSMLSSSHSTQCHLGDYIKSTPIGCY
ncbi:unnamed protein product [Heligmosomoides polygyrus]|uniref:Serpentine receptor class gamma n=1 Tax=Heligmosomoides polygyrus TaxID=6339 RepID=A0A3P8C530_HELPZ|nr:unnamed protein product [Heligmosomoides polygyrus]